MGTPIITIGMASYDNAAEVWFTIEALRLYQDLQDCEILVIDNAGSKAVQKVCNDCKIRCIKYTEAQGTGIARNKVFDFASGEFTLCLDSHVLLYPDVITKLKKLVCEDPELCKNLLQGTIVLSALVNCYTHYLPEWRGEMWGIWPDALPHDKLPKDINEITMMGMGCFGCRTDSWLRFHEQARGFDGVEGVIHEKYRRAGRKVYNIPWLKWVHWFGAEHKYSIRREEKVRNFLLGFKEIDLDPKPIYDYFGKEFVENVASKI